MADRVLAIDIKEAMHVDVGCWPHRLAYPALHSIVEQTTSPRKSLG